MLKGTPTTAGVYNFTIKVCDQNSCFGTREYTLTINSPACPNLSISPQSLSGGTVGTAYAQSLTASGGTAPYSFSLNTGELPPGVQINGSALTGTPTKNGAYSVTLKVTDANGCTATKPYIINVGCATITLNPATLQSATVGTPYHQPLSA